MIDKTSSRIKAVIHGFFLSITTTIAEPSIILPLIVNFFSGSLLIVGIYSSLLKGGAILVQLFAAFGAQNLGFVQPPLRYVFLTRFLSWFFIGLSIYFFGDSYPKFTLFCIGFGLFTFSFAAGFGSIYFNELLAKVFTHRYRGKVFAQRQAAAGVGALISGFVAGVMLEIYEPPLSFAYLFMLSALMMAFGIAAFALIEEPKKTNITKKERSFREFIKNSFVTLRSDKILRDQIITYLLAYAHLFSLPFIILDAQSKISISGMDIGYLLSAQIVGAMLSNIFWARLSRKESVQMIITLSFMLYITANTLAIFADTFLLYLTLFAFLGAAIDGMRLAFSNNILIIAPEEKRPVYIALQSNLTSFGLFFSIVGAVIVELFGYQNLYIFTIVVLIFGLLYSRKLSHSS